MAGETGDPRGKLSGAISTMRRLWVAGSRGPTLAGGWKVKNIALLLVAGGLLGCPGPERPEGEEVPSFLDASASAGRSAPEASGCAGDPALRCRCPQQPLADYYQSAEEVVAGRVVAVVEEYGEGEAGWDHLLAVEVVGRPWKWDAGRPAVLPGETVL